MLRRLQLSAICAPAWICLVLLLALLAPSAATTAPAAQIAPAKVRVIHASSDAPAVDVSVNGNQVLTNVPFRQVSDYLDVPAGNTRIEVFPTGSAGAVIDKVIPFRSGAAYTIAATNLVANIQARVYQDDLRAPTDGAAKVRFYRLSEVQATVDFVFKPEDGDEIVIPTTYAKTASIYAEVPAGDYEFIVYAAGTRDNPVISIDLDLQPGTINSVVASGNPPEPPLQLQQVSTQAVGTAASGPARVRVMHASPDAPGVDVHVNDSQALTNVPFRQVSGYLDVPAGPARFQVFPTGTTTPVLDVTLPLRAGIAYTVAATDPVASIKPRIYEDDIVAPAPGAAKLRFYRLSEVQAPIDLTLRPAGGGQDITVPNIFPKTDGITAEAPAGQYDLLVFAAGTTNQVISLRLDMANGSVNSVVASGNPPAPSLQLRQFNQQGQQLAESAQETLQQPAPAAPQQPAPQQPQRPATLPATSEGARAPLVPLSIAAVVLLSSGLIVLIMRRKRY